MLEDAQPRELYVAKPGNRRDERLGLLAVDPRHEDVLAARRELTADANDLFGGLSLAKDDLGHALAESAMVIDGRVAEVGEGKRAQLGGRVIDGGRAIADAFEELAQPREIHEAADYSA